MRDAILFLATVHMLLTAVRAYRERRARQQWERLVERVLNREGT